MRREHKNAAAFCGRRLLDGTLKQAQKLRLWPTRRLKLYTPNDARITKTTTMTTTTTTNERPKCAGGNRDNNAEAAGGRAAGRPVGRGEARVTNQQKLASGDRGDDGQPPGASDRRAGRFFVGPAIASGQPLARLLSAAIVAR